MSDLDCICHGWMGLQKLHLCTQSLISQQKSLKLCESWRLLCTRNLGFKWPETYRTTKGPSESQENPVILHTIASEESKPTRHQQTEHLRCFCAVLSKCISSFSSNWFDFFFFFIKKHTALFFSLGKTEGLTHFQFLLAEKKTSIWI